VWHYTVFSCYISGSWKTNPLLWMVYKFHSNENCWYSWCLDVSFWMRFSKNVSSLGTYGPLAHPILFYQTVICGGTAKSAVYRDRPSTLNELKSAISVYIRNISQTDLQKVFVSKIKQVQACVDTRGRCMGPYYRYTPSNGFTSCFVRTVTISINIWIL
jgi:hypothetical protein